MSLTDEERRILMELEFEKATKIFSQVDSLSSQRMLTYDSTVGCLHLCYLAPMRV